MVHTHKSWVPGKVFDHARSAEFLSAESTRYGSTHMRDVFLVRTCPAAWCQSWDLEQKHTNKIFQTCSDLHTYSRQRAHPPHTHTSASLIFKVKLLGVLRSGTAAPKISWMPPLRQGAVTFLCWLTFYRIAALMVSNFHGRPSVMVYVKRNCCRIKKDTHVYPSTCVDCRFINMAKKNRKT